MYDIICFYKELLWIYFSWDTKDISRILVQITRRLYPVSIQYVMVASLPCSNASNLWAWFQWVLHFDAWHILELYYFRVEVCFMYLLVKLAMKHNSRSLWYPSNLTSYLFRVELILPLYFDVLPFDFFSDLFHKGLVNIDLKVRVDFFFLFPAFTSGDIILVFVISCFVLALTKVAG
jgi:hypothetical protein